MFENNHSGSSLHVAVLFGGDSSEREVSLESGKNVGNALADRGHHVELIDTRETPPELISSCTDIILPMLHGTGSEDGALQERLGKLDIPWLGSSAEASRLTFNKIATRSALQAAGLPVPPGVALNRRSSPSLVLEAAKSVGFPLVVKPAEQGSSVGITLVHEKNELNDAVQAAIEWGPRFLIEQYIAGREVTIPALDDYAFPAVEVLPQGTWFSYQAKYHDQATRYSVSPGNLPRNLDALVLRACQICGVAAISRTDLRIDDDGNCWILEINTIPGMTSHSLVPMSAGSLGISIGELCEQMLLKKLGRISLASWERRPVSRAG